MYPYPIIKRTNIIICICSYPMIKRTTAATQNTIIIATGDGGHFSQLLPSRMKQVARS